MNFTTDCQFLENELLDVVRLFKRRPETLTHSFRFEKGVLNLITGVATKSFTMDKTPEHLWDEKVPAYFKAHQVLLTQSN